MHIDFAKSAKLLERIERRTKAGAKTMSLIISDDIVKASGLSETDLLQELIILLFQQEKLSLGKASELLGMTQTRFQRLIADRGICVHYDVAEFNEDLQHLKQKGWL
jgi:predicted HTH domain antitoxin